MIAAGLIAGSLIGTYWFGQPSVTEEAVSPAPPAVPPPVQTEGADEGAPTDTSLDTGSMEGSI
jgi:hypothetical protein